MPHHSAALLAVAALAAMVTSPSPARRSVSGDIRLYGADPSPGNDDTAALQKALANCSNTNGQVYIPAGTYTVSRPVPAGWHPRMGAVLNDQATPILPVPSHCTVFGDGDTS